MKILHVVTDNDRRGAQVFARDLDAALRVRGHDSRRVALEPGRFGGLDSPVLSTGGGRFSGLRQLRKEMSEADVTVAHGSSTLLACTLASFGSRKMPFVVRQISETRFWARGWQRRVRVQWYLRNARAVVALAAGPAADLRDYLEVRDTKIFVVPNGVPIPDSERFAGRSQRRKEFGFGDDTVALAYVGALVPEKGVDRAIEASGSLKAPLLIAGDGPIRQELEDLAERVAPGLVTFVGAVDDPYEVFAAADVMLLPSRGGDSMPAVLIEAGMAALPAVTTDVGAIADVVVNEVTGLVVDRDGDAGFIEAVSKMVGDDATRRAYAQAAQRHCESHFSIEVIAQQYEQVLTEVLR